VKIAEAPTTVDTPPGPPTQGRGLPHRLGFLFCTLAGIGLAFGLLFPGTPCHAQQTGPSAVRILSGLDTRSLRFAAAKEDLRRKLLSFGENIPPSDSGSQITVLGGKITRWVPPPLSGTKYYDRVAQELTKRNLDLSNTLDFGAAGRQLVDLLKRRRKQQPKRAAELPVPTARELGVLQFLWTKGPATSLDLYAGLDSSLLARTTAEQFWSELHRMAARGFVIETVVSPQQLMLVGIGPFGVSVEMLAKNRRNRIWRYEPLADRETIITLLQSRQFLASRSGRIREAERISRLLTYLLTSPTKQLTR